MVFSMNVLKNKKRWQNKNVKKRAMNKKNVKNVFTSMSYCAIVTLSLRRAVFTILVFKKFHDLEMGVKGHSRSLRVI